MLTPTERGLIIDNFALQFRFNKSKICASKITFRFFQFQINPTDYSRVPLLNYRFIEHTHCLLRKLNNFYLSWRLREHISQILILGQVGQFLVLIQYRERT